LGVNLSSWREEAWEGLGTMEYIGVFSWRVSHVYSARGPGDHAVKDHPPGPGCWQCWITRWSMLQSIGSDILLIMVNTNCPFTHDYISLVDINRDFLPLN
jgi:hypothetical protein